MLKAGGRLPGVRPARLQPAQEQPRAEAGRRPWSPRARPVGRAPARRCRGAPSGRPPAKSRRNSAAVIEPAPTRARSRLADVGDRRSRAPARSPRRAASATAARRRPRRPRREPAASASSVAYRAACRRPERQRGRPGERGDVDQDVGVEVGDGLGQGVGEHQPALGVGVDDLGGAAAVVADHVAGAVRRAADGVLGERQQAGHAAADARRAAARPARRARRRAPVMSRLHRHHGLARLDRQAAGVEGDALADEHAPCRAPRRHPVRARARGGLSRGGARRARADGEQAAEALRRRARCSSQTSTSSPAGRGGVPGRVGQPGGRLDVGGGGREDAGTQLAPGRAPRPRSTACRGQRGVEQDSAAGRASERSLSAARRRRLAAEEQALDGRTGASSPGPAVAPAAAAEVGDDPAAAAGGAGQRRRRHGAATGGRPAPTPSSEDARGRALAGRDGQPGDLAGAAAWPSRRRARRQVEPEPLGDGQGERAGLGRREPAGRATVTRRRAAAIPAAAPAARRHRRRVGAARRRALAVRRPSRYLRAPGRDEGPGRHRPGPPVERA